MFASPAYAKNELFLGYQKLQLYCFTQMKVYVCNNQASIREINNIRKAYIDREVIKVYL